MDIYGVEIQIHAILSSTLDGGESLPSCTGCFTYGERTPIAHWIRDWGGPQSWYGCGGKEKNPSSCQEPNFRGLTCNLVTILTELSHLPIIFDEE
jgi:hypothetical protein